MTPKRDDALALRSRAYIVRGALTSVASLSAAATGHPIGYGVAVLGGVLGGLFVHSGIELGRSVIALPLYRDVVAMIGRGELDEAEAALPDGGNELVQRVAGLLRTAIASARGDFEKAANAATESLALPLRASRTWDDVLHLEARSHRALAHAVLGHSITEDLDVIERATNAVSSLIARAELTRAVVLARTDKKTELGEHLTRHAALILDHASTPRERALYRALRAWTRATSGVYREPPRVSGDGKLRQWVEKVVPAAAPFASSEPTAAKAPAAPPSDPHKAAAAIRWRIGRPAKKWPLYVVLAGVFATSLYADQLIESAGILLIGTLLLMLIAYIRVALSNGQSSILEADRHIALGRIPEARAALRRVANGGTSIGASAGHRLAALENREGHFQRARVEVETALALCKQPATLEATRFFVMPGLLAESAVAFAGLDRFAESEKELTVLREGFPEYAFLDAASFRARLLGAMRRGDRDAAAAIASERTPYLALDFATELLADLALGDHSFEAELGSSPMTAAWLQKVVPSAQSADSMSRSSNETAPT